jgi:subtilase family serine protease
MLFPIVVDLLKCSLDTKRREPWLFVCVSRTIGLGRGYPDVAFAACSLAYVVNNYVLHDSGTSFSAPIFAGMISSINSARIAKGLSSLGFLNPILYNLAATQPQIFNDATSGFNNCDSNGKICCSQGFNASTGWYACWLLFVSNSLKIGIR